MKIIRNELFATHTVTDDDKNVHFYRADTAEIKKLHGHVDKLEHHLKYDLFVTMKINGHFL